MYYLSISVYVDMTAMQAGHASLLPLCGPRDGALSSGCQACLQVPFSAEPSHWPQELVCFSFLVLGIEIRALSVLGRYFSLHQVPAPKDFCCKVHRQKVLRSPGAT